MALTRVDLGWALLLAGGFLAAQLTAAPLPDRRSGAAGEPTHASASTPSAGPVAEPCAESAQDPSLARGGIETAWLTRC